MTRTKQTMAVSLNNMFASLPEKTKNFEELEETLILSDAGMDLPESG